MDKFLKKFIFLFFSSLTLSFSSLYAQTSTYIFLSSPDSVELTLTWDSSGRSATLLVVNRKTVGIIFDTLFQTDGTVSCKNLKGGIEAIYLGNGESDRNDFHEKLNEFQLGPGKHIQFTRNGWDDISSPYIMLNFCFVTEQDFTPINLTLANNNIFTCKP